MSVGPLGGEQMNIKRNLVLCVLIASSCRPETDSTPHSFAAQQATVQSLMNDVFVWTGMYSLDTTPEERTIKAVQQKIRRRTAVRTDYEAAFSAQRAKQEYLSRSFESINELRAAVAESTKLANAIVDPELRSSALAVVKCSNTYLQAAEEYRQTQSKKAKWVESVFAALRDAEEAPGDKDEIDAWNRTLSSAVDDVQHLTKEEEMQFARFKGVMARKIADGKVAAAPEVGKDSVVDTPPN